MWLRVHDGADRDPMLLRISRNRTELHRHLGLLMCLMLYCASQGSNGFVPGFVVRENLRSKRLFGLFTDPPGGGTPLLHRPGDDCECLEGRVWPEYGDYYVHHYLKWNPTKEEYDVNAAKKAELDDAELKAAVRARDRDTCRYCARLCNHADRRGATGLVFDHVDPRLAAGAANLVVSCRSCNSKKGKRTPTAAGMALLPPPGDQPPNQAGDPGPTNGSGPGPTTSRARTGRDGTGQAPQLVGAGVGAAVGDAGPNGHRQTTGPPPQRPHSAYPDPYLRTAITGAQPEDFAGLPDPDQLDDLVDLAEQEGFEPPPGGL
jgi:HNH endonuclease